MSLLGLLWTPPSGVLEHLVTAGGVGMEATGFPWCLAGVEWLLATLLLLISVSLRCSFPGPFGRDGRLLEGFKVFSVSIGVFGYDFFSCPSWVSWAEPREFTTGAPRPLVCLPSSLHPSGCSGLFHISCPGF